MEGPHLGEKVGFRHERHFSSNAQTDRISTSYPILVLFPIMSADLLAAFGIEEKPLNHGSSQGVPGQPSLVQESDPFAAFEAPTSKDVTRSSHLPLTKKSATAASADSNVLFDADDFENHDDDDFGEFEHVEAQQSYETQAARSLSSHHGLIDLPSNSIDQDNSIYDLQPAAGISNEITNGDDEWGEFTATESLPGVPTLHPVNSALDAVATRTVVPASGVNPKLIDSNDGDDGEWDDFKDGHSTVQEESIPDSTKQTPSDVKHERPMNVPPPAIILALLTKAVSLVSSQVKTAGSDSAAIMAVQMYRVSGRVIGGRSHRWKRDTILAQSMKIGAAGRSGGMKLASIDKGETRREEQETEDLLHAWSTHLHSLNQAMLRAKVSKPPISLSSKLMIRTATGPDVILATHVCPICGLKRNERVNGIDVAVSDTFGDFWIEYWGHRDCHDFWYEFSQYLDQR